MSCEIFSLTTQSGSSGTTSQNDKGPAQGAPARGGRRRDSCARVAPRSTHHSVAGRRGEQTLAKATSRNTRVTFSLTRVRDFKLLSYKWNIHSSIWRSATTTRRRRTSEGHESGAAQERPSASFVREARVAGRWLVLYSVCVRYCTSPGLSKRARPSKTAIQALSIRGARSR